MSIRKINFVSGEYYHIFNRGNSKQEIFHDHEDYFRFMGLLYASNSENNFRIFGLNREESLYDFERGKQIVFIGSYCLMPNHFHLLITQVEEKTDKNISKFMQKLTTAYAMYYNKKYKHSCQACLLNAWQTLRLLPNSLTAASMTIHLTRHWLNEGLITISIGYMICSKMAKHSF